jgi:predicted nucleic acid-binding protein
LIGWLLDTNILSEASKLRPHERVIDWLQAQPEEVLYLSVLTIAEGDKGISKLDRDDPNRAKYMVKWQALEERFEGRILPLANPVIRRWGTISGGLEKTGRPAPVIDTMMAATALEHDLYLVTRNTSDVQNSGAALFNPWQDNPANFPLS